MFPSGNVFTKHSFAKNPMTLPPIKNFPIVLLIPLLMVLLVIYGTYTRNRKLKNLLDKKMYREVLSNFSVLKARIKIFLCLVVPCIYSLLLIGDRKGNVLMLSINSSRYLMKLLIIILLVEQLISTRKREVKKYSSNKNTRFS